MRQLDIFKTNSFHNTIPIRDEKKLDELENRARKQEEKILDFFKENKYSDFTPCEIWIKFGQQWPLTSIRRSITNLTKAGVLVRTENKRKGLYGELNCTWIFKPTNQK